MNPKGHSRIMNRLMTPLDDARLAATPNIGTRLYAQGKRRFDGEGKD